MGGRRWSVPYIPEIPNIAEIAAVVESAETDGLGHTCSELQISARFVIITNKSGDKKSCM